MKEILEEIGLENIKHNKIVKYKKHFADMVGRTLTEKVYLWYYDIECIPVCDVCGDKEKSFLNFQKGYRISCSATCTRKHPEFRKILSDAVKHSEKAKAQRADRSKKGAEALMLKMKSDEEFRENIYKQQQETRTQTFLEKYGVDNPMKIEEVALKNHTNMRQTNINSGRWLNYDDIGDDFKTYCKKVWYITNKQNIEILENIEKRGHISVEGSYHLDHKYSIKQGFIDNIPVWIIGNICNLEMIPARINSCVKLDKCSISKEELFREFFN